MQPILLSAPMRCFFLVVTVTAVCTGRLFAAERVTPKDLFPPDTVAAVVVHNLDELDAKVPAVSQLLGFPLPRPITMVAAATGVADGLDRRGDLKLSFCQAPDDTRPPVLCLQIPVTDYDRFITSLGGQPSGGISTVRILDQTLVAAKRGDWAVLMDHANRQQLESALADDTPRFSLPEAWAKWLGKLDITLILGPELVREICSPASPPSMPGHLDDQAAEELFGQFGPPIDQDDDEPSNKGLFAFGLAPAWQSIVTRSRALLAEQAVLRGVMSEADYLAVGVTITTMGHTNIRLRTHWNPDSQLADVKAPAKADGASNSLAATPFITAGGGSLPVPVASFLARHAIKQELVGFQEMSTQPLPPRNMVQLHEAIEQIVQRVVSMTVVEKPTDEDDGVYSNGFLVLEVDDAQAVRDEIADAIKSWNWLMDHAEGDFRLQFATEQKQIAGKDSLEFTADMTQAVGGETLPEIRKAMEELFGPGGIYRFQLVPIDERRVLMANATEKQTKQFLSELSADGPRLAESPHVASGRSLLPPSRQFEFFLSPREFSQRLRRESEAGLENIVGGPLVSPFPEGPAVAIAAETDAGGLSVDIGVPAEVLRAAVPYFLQP